mgnify:CR=1 FL=1
MSPAWKVNKEDLWRWFLQTVIFFTAPALMYLAQLQGTLAQNKFLLLNDFIPNLVTIGGIEGWAIGVAINFFLKLRDGKK